MGMLSRSDCSLDSTPSIAPGSLVEPLENAPIIASAMVIAERPAIATPKATRTFVERFLIHST